jgi:hypothetical protein
MQRTAVAHAAKAATAYLPIFALLAAAAPAAAQLSPLVPGTGLQQAPAPEETSVGERVPAGYVATGGQVGDFLIYPTADLQEYYNSNVFVTETGKKSDVATFFDPAITANSNWNTDALNFLVTGQIERYANQVSENQSNFSAASNGRYDISNGVFLTGAIGYEYAHEDRTSPDTIFNQAFPTAYQVMSGRLGYVHDAGQLGFRVDTGADYYTYNNNVTSTGTPIPETDRNRIEYGVTPRVSYELTPGYEAYVQTPVNLRQYQATVDANGLKRDSYGYEFDAGTAFKITNLVNGQVYLGYEDQVYQDARLSSPAGLTFGGNVLWNATQEDSVRLTLARTVEETTVSTASSFLQSSVALDVEHQLRANVLLTAGGSYSDQNYQGLNRDDNVYAANAGIRYLINEYLSANVTAVYAVRLSNVSPNGYHQETLLASLHFQY